MEMKQAHAIVAAISSFFFADMELGIRPAPDYSAIEGISLKDMALAAEMVRAENDSVREGPANEDGTRTFSVVPDDRLIAAVYTLLHYGPLESDEEPEDDFPLTVRQGDRFRFIAIGIRSAPTPAEAEAA